MPEPCELTDEQIDDKLIVRNYIWECNPYRAFMMFPYDQHPPDAERRAAAYIFHTEKHVLERQQKEWDEKWSMETIKGREGEPRNVKIT